MKPWTLALCCLLASTAAAAADRLVARVVAELDDPANDEQAGELDLRSLRITRDDAGYWFEAGFARPVRDPAGLPGGSEGLAQFARRGFYAFNLDLYIDLDRVPGSGRTDSLPGRGVAVDAAFAWERAVVLTPRPELMREQLTAAQAQDSGQPRDEVAAGIDAQVFFPTRIRVTGRRIAFFVPAAFLAGERVGFRPDSDWALVGLVTAAQTEVGLAADWLGPGGPALPRLTLGALPGPPQRPAVVDWLMPDAARQGPALAAGLPLAGVTWSAAGAALGAAPPAASAPMPASTSPVAQRLRELQDLFDQKLIDAGEYREQRRRILNSL